MEENARSLDIAQVASTDLVALNNTVVNMRGSVKSAKVQVINKLAKNIRKFKAKQGSDEQKQKYLRKAERQLEELYAIKALKPDKVSKFALANKLSFDEICKQKTATTELRCLGRLAHHKQVAKKVADFRAQHADWPALAAYLLVKQTGRRFKSTKQKEKASKTAPANINAARTATHSYLTNKLGASEKIDQLLTGPRPKKGQLKSSSTEQKGKDGKDGKQNAAERDSGVDDDHDVAADKNIGTVIESDKDEEMFENDVRVSTEKDDESGEDSQSEGDSEGEEDSEAKTEEEDSEDSDSPTKTVNGAARDSGAKSQLHADHSFKEKTLRENTAVDTEGSDTDREEKSDDDDDSSENLVEEVDVAASSGAENSGEDNDIMHSNMDIESSCDEDSSSGRKLKTKLFQKKISQRDIQEKPKRKNRTNSSLTDVKRAGDMVVKPLDLNSADSDIFTDSPSNSVPDILLEEPSSKSKMAKDPFFLGSGGDSDDEPLDDEDNFTSSRTFQRDNRRDDETQEDREERTLQAGRKAVESTFLDSLDGTGNDWRDRKFAGRGRGVGGDRWGRGERGSFRSRGRGFEDRRGDRRGRFEDRRGGFRGGRRDLHDQGRGGSGDRRGGFRGRGRGFTDRSRGYGYDFKGQGRGRGLERHSNGGDRRGRQAGPAQKSFQTSRQSDSSGGGKFQPKDNKTVVSSQQEKVHPSWEASQKRKLQEQQTSFQGKRIKFDD